MTNLFAGILLPIVVIAIVGLQIVAVLTETNHAYAQWILPSDANQIYKNIHHSSLGIVGIKSEGNSQSNNNNNNNSHK